MIPDIITPAYVFDIDELILRTRKIKELLGKNVSLCFAIKANPFLLNAIKDEIDCFEVCSTGEFRIGERECLPLEKIVLSGVYKNKDDIKRIVGICGDRAVYTIESTSQAELLDFVAKENGIVHKVLLRLSSGNQFGMDAINILKIIENRKNYAFDILGIQYYSGTQKRENKIVREIEKIDDFVQAIENTGFIVSRIEYSPGLKIGYFQDEQIDEAVELDVLTRSLSVFNGRNITLELGRFLVADCGSYYTTIVDAKNNEGINYAIVDGGINHLNYFGQTMAMKIPWYKYSDNNQSEEEEEEEQCTICGSLCTASDVLVRNVPIKPVVGNVICFDKAGAYSVTESMYLFLSHDLPRIYFRQNGTLTLVRDFMRTDIINSI